MVGENWPFIISKLYVYAYHLRDAYHGFNLLPIGHILAGITEGLARSSPQRRGSDQAGRG
jgi:hypothetical protein